MIERTSLRMLAGLVAGTLGAGVVALTTGSDAVAQHDRRDLTTPGAHSAQAGAAAADSAAADESPKEGLASARAPYVPGVWHVPADVRLLIGPGGSRYSGPAGSLFNGPVEVVKERVDLWWAQQLAAGLTPEEADLELARMGR